ncbi:MAG: carboxymuconolactone decarboxylase family protein [Bryobacteraceae bacterium]|jgi:lipoyl-dependent peroxiredoxin subunit D
MPLALLLDSIPEYARDLKLNLSAVLAQPELSAQQAWGTAVSCAIASKSPRLAEALAVEAAQHIDERAVTAAKTAAAIMGMNNIYYRFRHLSGNPKYEDMPAKLRMQALRSHGADALDFELWCLAVSAINACQACVEGHERALRERGIGEEKILAAVRIAAVVFALAAVMESETSQAK